MSKPLSVISWWPEDIVMACIIRTSRRGCEERRSDAETQRCEEVETKRRRDEETKRRRVSRLRPTTLRLFVSLSLLCAIGSPMGASAAGGPQYSFTDLGTLTDRSSAGWSHISGTPGTPKIPAEPFINHAFHWFDGTMIDLGAFPSGACSPLGCESRANDINDLGLATGWSADPYQIPFIWSAVKTPTLDAGLNALPSLFPGGMSNSEARSINNDMIIAGESRGPGGIPRRVARWHHDGSAWVVADLGTLQPGDTGHGGAYGINTSGQIVGQANDITGSQKAFLWLPEPAYGLPAGMNALAPASSSSTGLAINDLGQVVGVIGVAQGFIWLPEPAYGYPAGLSMLPLHQGAHNVYPSDINNHGEIVGTVFLGNGMGGFTNHGAILIDGEWTLLDNLIPEGIPGEPWVIRNFALSAAINDAGQITGDARSDGLLDINSQHPTHAYRLTPIGPGDINADGVVDVDDLVAVILSWGACGDCNNCPADVAPFPKGDCVVDVDDLVAVILNWG
jgi:probable HAF family extracellular repeat protein